MADPRGESRNDATLGCRLPQAIVTTSWDDGHVLDRRVAELLQRYGICGTFYVAPMNSELPPSKRLSSRDLATLACNFEVGGHTLTHQRLTAVSDVVARTEIAEGKDAVEQALGRPIRSFCYPGGAYGSQHPAMVAAAGFTMARTVRRGVVGPSPRFETHTTVHAYRHLVDGPVALRLGRGNPVVARRIYWHWDDLAIAFFDRVLSAGGVFHLWGHSWEIDSNGDWPRLERVLSHIGNRSDVRYFENGVLAAGLP